MNTLKGSFSEKVLELQDPWKGQASTEILLERIPDRELRDALRKKWSTQANRPSSMKWADIDTLASSGVSEVLLVNVYYTLLMNSILIQRP